MSDFVQLQCAAPFFYVSILRSRAPRLMVQGLAENRWFAARH